MGLNKLKVIVPSQINDFLQKDPKGATYFYIIDEYYHILRQEKLTLDSTQEIPGIFKVGIGQEAILMTGHYSD